MKIFAAFPSKYLKAADLHDKHVRAIMSHVILEEVTNKDGSELLPILYFNDVPKGMVLNITNSKTIATFYGEETEAWKGMPIVLFPAMVAFGAETVSGIRMKAPSAAERIRAINESQHKDALGEHMIEQRVNYESQTQPAKPLTEGWMERAQQVCATKKPKPKPKVSPIQDVMHDAAGVIWDETAERPMTPAERSELLTEQLKESLARSAAAMDERRAIRGAAQPGDGLDLPTLLQHAKASPAPKEPDYGPNAWIELMQAAE